MVTQPAETRGLRFYVSAWKTAARPVTLSAAVAPVLVGTALAAREVSINWLLFTLAFAGSVLIQVGTNLADEYTDHRSTGGATKYLAPHKVIARGLLSERSVLAGTIASFGLSTAMGLYIVYQVGWPILVVGLFGTMAGYLHSSGPFPLGHYLLGELTVFIFMGPLIVISAYYVQAQAITWSIFWASFPIALLVTAILQCNNLRDREDDRAEDKYTFATLLNLPMGRWIYVGLAFGAYVALIIDMLAGVVPLLAVFSLATLPVAYGLARRLWSAATRPEYNLVLVGTAKLHMQMGTLMALGIAVSAILDSGG